jgi:hypothetical protein
MAHHQAYARTNRAANQSFKYTAQVEASLDRKFQIKCRRSSEAAPSETAYEKHTMCRKKIRVKKEELLEQLGT